MADDTQLDMVLGSVLLCLLACGLPLGRVGGDPSGEAAEEPASAGSPEPPFAPAPPAFDGRVEDVRQRGRALIESATSCLLDMNGAIAAAKASGERIEHGAQAMNDLEKTMSDLNTHVCDSFDVFAELQRKAARISNVVTAMKAIAMQARLLAVNAAVEAGHAGAAGRGFGVVAQEVKALAGRTDAASAEVGAMAESLSHACSVANERVSKAAATTGTGQTKVAACMALMNDIQASAAQRVKIVAGTVAALEVQRHLSQQILACIEGTQPARTPSDAQVPRVRP